VKRKTNLALRLVASLQPSARASPRMLRALFIVCAVASSALLDDATAADADARAEHIVSLCAEHHRDNPRNASSEFGRVAMLTSIPWSSRRRGPRSA
jgi:hypothetical protein